MYDTLSVVQFCAVECERQGCRPMDVSHMFQAYHHAAIRHKVGRELDLTLINDIALLIDRRNVNYRNGPAAFMNGREASRPEDIERQLGLLMENLDGITIDEFIKQWLTIHPYIDGNGRTAAIMYNYLYNTMDEPVTLPDYFS